jgi:Tol biopolymer transport system component
MTHHPTVEERITNWLESEAPPRAPDRLLADTLGQTQRIRRHRSDSLRFPAMNRVIAIVAAAAVVVIAVAGLAGGVFRGPPGPGGVPAPTVVPTQPTQAAVGASGTPNATDPSSPAASADPNAAQATGQLAYCASVDGNMDVYLANGDGSGVARLTTDPGEDNFPAWSPDGASIAFIRDGDVYVMAADGSNVTPMTTTPDEEAAPSFTSDGTGIIFGRRFDAEEWRIHQIDVDGSNERVLYDASPIHIEGIARMLGDDLLIMRDTIAGGGLEIARVDLATGDVVALTDYRDGEESLFAVSSDEMRIAYRSEGPDPGIMVMDADGTNSTHVTDGIEGGTLAWTADDAVLSFVDQGVIRLVRPDGTGVTRLLDGDCPAWRPGG